MQPSACPTLRSAYASLLSQKERFKAELKKAAVSGDFSTLDTLKQEIEATKVRLEENLTPFERELHLKEQYEIRKQTLEHLGLLETRNGILGIEAIDKRFHPFPTLPELSKKIRENKELLGTKIGQGFTRLSITPFGLKAERLFETMKQTILKHKQEGTLLSTNGDPLDLDVNEPIYIWDGYQNQRIAYFPTSFDQTNHEGKTKKEILSDPNQPFPGFLVSFIEENLDIPRETATDEEPGGRKRIKANKTPIDYLELLHTGAYPGEEKPDTNSYQGESGTTIEEWATLFLTNLEETDTVIDDYQGTGSINWNLGTYFPAGGDVSYAYWDRDNRRALVYRYDVRVRDEGGGARSAVRV